jgi:hypothetical protein
VARARPAQIVAAAAMILNLVPEFLAVCASPTPGDAYAAYHRRYERILSAYWHNNVLDPDSPHAAEVVRGALAADRRDLERLLATVDLERVATEALDRAAAVLELDSEVDLYLIVGVGAANAAELVVDGRGVAVLCLEHFTGQTNPDTFGLGLRSDLLPLWIAHEVAHLVRYTSPTSRSPLQTLVAQAGGAYDYWETGSRTVLRELLLNEGLAVHAARAVAPGHPDEDYFGFSRRQFRRMRELETFLFRAVDADLDRAGLGLRLRYLSGGVSAAARAVDGRVLPERSGYYIGARMAEALIIERGIAAALRAGTGEFSAAEARHAPEQAESA